MSQETIRILIAKITKEPFYSPGFCVSGSEFYRVEWTKERAGQQAWFVKNYHSNTPIEKVFGDTPTDKYWESVLPSNKGEGQ